MGSNALLLQEKIWFDKASYDLAEKKYYEKLAKQVTNSCGCLKTEQRSSVNNEAVNSKVIVDVEKGKIDSLKAPANVWVDKIVYDIAEKEYYEKLEKSRLVGLGIARKVQDELKNENKLEVDGNDIEFEGENIKNSHNKCGVVSPPFSAESQRHSNNVQVSSLEKPCPARRVTPKKTGHQITSPRQKMLHFEDEDLTSELIDPDSKKRLRFEGPLEFKENPKPQKIRLTEQKYLSDSVKDKKQADEKKSQDSVDNKLHKGLQKENKKTTNCNSCSPKNKSTNVNTIPSFSKMTTLNGLSLNSQFESKGERESDRKNETVLLSVETAEPAAAIIKESVQTCITDDLSNKKETKKNKKNKKRHRDQKGVSQNGSSWNSLAGEVAKARQHIKNSLQCIDDIASITSSNVVIEVNNRISTLERENSEMKQKVKELTDLLSKFEQRLASIEKTGGNSSGGSSTSKPLTASVSSQSAKVPTASVSSQSAKVVTASVSSQSSKQQQPQPQQCDDEDDGVDLFGSDSEDEDAEVAKIKEQRLAEYAAKKDKKPAVIAKSSIVLDVKPWDDTTNMEVMEKEVRKIQTDGLLWGASQLVPLAYGIYKLQISCVVEDEKVSVDWLQESIETIEDYVQSVDIAAFNKI